MRATATIIVIAAYGLHQDLWLWHDARPLVFGVFPVGLFYHAAYTLALSLIFWFLVTYLWPSHLEGASSSRATHE
jgi:hypothetical protein